MGSFFKYIIVGYLIYIVLKYVVKLFSNGISPQYHRGSTPRNEEGSIKVKKTAHKENKHVSGGEYVDYEELEK